MGVEHVWIIDLARREAHVCTRTEMRSIRTGELIVPGTQVRVSLDEVFAEYDELV